ncbi:hypothetical protein F7725_011005 [Dissostichus mawsoni]|uniref:Uncharacterized protein n=1 Tax=Dissostichus mawsoni TaxID=36200 RepID=A0A7J5Z7L8_DISMA|nr:hypothetical protein F7725_011005 [Dissostichus mawsoni]
MSLTKQFMIPMALEEMPLSFLDFLLFLPVLLTVLATAFFEPFLAALTGVLQQACLESEADQVSLAGLLKSHNSGALEAQIGLEVLSYLPHLGGQLLPGSLSSGGFTGGLLGSRHAFCR